MQNNEKFYYTEIKKLLMDYLDHSEKNLVRSGSEINDIVDSTINKDNLFPIENKVDKLHKIKNLILSYHILLNVNSEIIKSSELEEIFYDFKTLERRVEKLETYEYYFHKRDGIITNRFKKFEKNKRRGK